MITVEKNLWSLVDHDENQCCEDFHINLKNGFFVVCPQSGGLMLCGSVVYFCPYCGVRIFLNIRETKVI